MEFIIVERISFRGWILLFNPQYVLSTKVPPSGLAGRYLCKQLSMSVIGFWDNQPEQQVWANAGDAAWQGGDQEKQPEPERADAKEFGQSAADAGQHSVMA